MEEQQVSRRKVFSGLFWVYLETICAQAVTFVVTIILARLLSPADYGIIALVMVFVNVANVFVTSSFSFALIQKNDADDLDYQTMFWFNIVVSFLLFAVLFVIAPTVANYYDIPLLSPVLRVLALKIPLSAYNSIQLAKVSHDLNFKKSFMSTFGSTILSGAIGIVMAYTGYGIWALVVQVISNILFNTVFLMTIVKWLPKLQFSFIRLLPLINYGWKLLATGFMFTGYSELCKLIIGKRYSADDLGYYDKGTQFPHFIASNVDSTINRVLFPALSNQQDDRIRLKEITRRSAKTSAYIMTPILFGLAITAPTIVHLLLTDKWLPCVPFIQIMCFSCWLQPTQSCSVQGIKAIGRSDIYLKVEIIAKICGLILLFSSIVLFDTTIAIAVSMLMTQIIAVILYGFYSQNLIGYKIKAQLSDLLSCGMIGLIMVVAVLIVGKIELNNILVLLMQIFTGAICYIAFSWLFKIEAFNYLYVIAKKHKYSIKR